MNEFHKRNDDIYEVISANIKAKRKLAKITQAELAERTHYSHEFIRRIEAPNGKKSFSLDTLVLIAEALDVKVVELLDGVDNRDK